MRKNVSLLMISAACKVFSSDMPAVHPMYNFSQEDLGRAPSVSQATIAKDAVPSTSNSIPTQIAKIKYPKDTGNEFTDKKDEKSISKDDSSPHYMFSTYYPTDMASYLSITTFQHQYYYGWYTDAFGNFNYASPYYPVDMSSILGAATFQPQSYYCWHTDAFGNFSPWPPFAHGQSLVF